MKLFLIIFSAVLLAGGTLLGVNYYKEKKEQEQRAYIAAETIKRINIEREKRAKAEAAQLAIDEKKQEIANNDAMAEIDLTAYRNGASAAYLKLMKISAEAYRLQKREELKKHLGKELSPHVQRQLESALR